MHSSTNTDRFIARVAAVFVAVVLTLGAYAWLAANGVAPAMPWSPVGQHQQRVEQRQQDAPDPGPVPAPVQDSRKSDTSRMV